MQDGLGRADGDDEIGLDESPVHAQRDRVRLAQLDELRVLGVVNHDVAREAAREAGRDDPELLELAAGGLAHQAGRDEERLALRRDAGTLELRGRRLQGHLARVMLGGRQR